MPTRKVIVFTACIVLLQGCDGSTDDPPGRPDAAALPPGSAPLQANHLDDELRGLLARHGITGDPSTGRHLPDISDPLAQLGKKLFFSKALGGEQDAACVSCHHPMLGGGDSLSMSFGVGAIAPNLLGPGRGDASGVPNVPRNAPTTFNIGLWDAALFMDSRVESLGKEVDQNGAVSGISTPDSGINVIDAAAGANLVAAQARFPVTSVEEMRGSLRAGESNDALRAHLAARIGDYGVGQGELSANRWLAEFRSAFSSSQSAELLITFDNIVAALTAYERSQVFVDNPWRAYVQGNNDAISEQAKRGALLFYTDANQQGGGCVQCHSGDLFTDEMHHAIGAPQFGPGKGNPNDHDFGRENINGNPVDRFRFRTPSLLNIEVTGPYMHTGSYESLQAVLDHYDNPDDAVNVFFADGGWCQLEQFEGVQNCASLYPDARQNSLAALNKTNNERRQNDPEALPDINLNNGARNDLAVFLRTLTDPCVTSRACMAPWVPTSIEAADNLQVNAVDINGNAL